jgi:hypothetical protein
VTFTSASPKVASSTDADSFYFQLSKALNTVAVNRKRAGQLIVMTPRRWAWITAALDGQGRPLVVPGDVNEQNAPGLVSRVVAEGLVGTLQNVPVLVSHALPATTGQQDKVLVLRYEDFRLWESTPVLRALVEPLSGTLEVRFQAYEYMGAIFERYPKSICVISGTGLADPNMG